MLKLEMTGARFSVLYRRNVLDRLVCQVRDCFYKSDGFFPVFAQNHSRTDLCFQRRQHKEIKTQAHLKVNKLPEALDTSTFHLESLPIDMNTIRPQAYEDLFEFEYTTDETVFRSSIRSWTSLLETMLDNVKEDIVEETLRPMMGTRTPPGPHSDVIDNFEEVAAALKPPNNEFFRTKKDQEEGGDAENYGSARAMLV